MTNEADDPKSISLFRHEGSTTFSTTDLKIRRDGSLRLSDYDIGPLCQEVYCHDDVEAEVVVKPECKDKLLLALLKARFAGDSQASSHFRSFLDAEGIPYDFDIWP